MLSRCKDWRWTGPTRTLKPCLSCLFTPSCEGSPCATRLQLNKRCIHGLQDPGSAEVCWIRLMINQQWYYYCDHLTYFFFLGRPRTPSTHHVRNTANC